MYKRTLFFGLLFSLLISCQNQEKIDFDTTKYEAEFSGYAKEYMTELKSVLVSNMQKGGPLKAVNVCSDTASYLTKAFSEKMNLTIKRASFENRNPENIPNEFEAKAIKLFEDLMKEGKLNAQTNLIEKETIDNKEMIRFAKPIFVEAPCLNCHGSQTEISEEVANVIILNYPNDKATGYKIGDLRGAISVTKEL